MLAEHVADDDGVGDRRPRPTIGDRHQDAEQLLRLQGSDRLGGKARLAVDIVGMPRNRAGANGARGREPRADTAFGTPLLGRCA